MDLVNVMVCELGIEGGTTLKSIYERAATEFGLSLCTPDVEPELRLQYPDQPFGGNFQSTIAMEPIIDSDGELTVNVAG